MYSEENDLNNQKKKIGEFFIQFDMVVSLIPFNIPIIIYKKNTSELEQRNIETLLCSMTASTLRLTYNSLIKDNYKDLPELVKINNEISKFIEGVTEIRNSFAHGNYRLGWKDFEGNLDKEYFSLRHSKATKNGYEKRSGIYKINQVEKLIEQMQRIYSALIIMHTILVLHSQGNDFVYYLNKLIEDWPKIGKIEFESNEIIN